MVNLNNKNRLTEDIVVYENFITPEESAKIIKVLDKVAENGTITWMPISFYESYSSILPQDGDSEITAEGLPDDIFSEIKKGIIKAVASVHEIDPTTVVQIGYHTQKWEPGAYARIHSDNTDQHGNSGPFARSRYAAFLYLNENFEGGILKFPKQDIEIVPKVGMLAAFDGGFNNMHEVTLIESGVRYTIGSFWDDREEDAYPQEVRDAWAEEMRQIREKQEIERKEWQDLLKEGYKLDMSGNKYKLGDDESDQ
jgi:hypothetical protein